MTMVQFLVSVGGKEWQKNGKHRVYFNDLSKIDELCEIFGLNLIYYSGSNIKSARLHGEKISNSDAHKLRDRLTKSYYNVLAHEWHTDIDGLDEAVLKAFDAAKK